LKYPIESLPSLEAINNFLQVSSRLKRERFTVFETLTNARRDLGSIGMALQAASMHPWIHVLLSTTAQQISLGL